MNDSEKSELEKIIWRCFVGFCFGVVIACCSCTDKTVVSVDARQGKQATIDSLQLVVDSLEYQNCLLQLTARERVYSINCLRDFITDHHLDIPPYCAGHPIDPRGCRP